MLETRVEMVNYKIKTNKKETMESKEILGDVEIKNFN